MSFRALAEVWDLTDDIESSEKWVLFALAYKHHEETGQCDPSVPWLAARLRLTERRVRDILRHLETKGFIKIHVRYSSNGDRTSNQYELLPKSRNQGGGAIISPPLFVQEGGEAYDPTVGQLFQEGGEAPRLKIGLSIDHSIDDQIGSLTRDSIASSTREGTDRSTIVASGLASEASARRGGDMDAFGRALLAQRFHPATLDKLAECGVEEHEGRVSIAADGELFAKLKTLPACDMLQRAAQEAGFTGCEVIWLHDSSA